MSFHAIERIGLLLMLVMSSPASLRAAQYSSWVATFEAGVDTRLVPAWNPAALQLVGPLYVGEQPPTPLGDDANAFEVVSNGNGMDNPADFELLFGPFDATGFSRVEVGYRLELLGGNAQAGLDLYLYDADGTGNSDGNGFHRLGRITGQGSGTFSSSLTAMNKRGRVQKLLLRSFDGQFADLTTAGVRQRVSLFSVRLISDTAAGDVLRVPCIEDPSRNNTILSQYSPCVMRLPGWDRYRMYFGRNEELGGTYADRIYLSENFGDGITGWTPPIMVLEPRSDAPGEQGLIHDPSIVWDGVLFHMYYTGTALRQPVNGQWGGRVFHATSGDGVSWTRLGAAEIAGLPAQPGSYGYGEPAVLHDDGLFRLYFFSDALPALGTILLAEGSDGHHFTYINRPTRLIATSPDVVKHRGRYYLHGSSSHERVVQQVSSAPRSFGQAFRVIFSFGPAGSWDAYHIGHPFAVPTHSRLYFSGTDDNVTGGSEMDNGNIGVTLIDFPDPPTSATDPLWMSLQE